MPFRRHADNPILSSRDLPYSANSVFNAAAVELEGDTLLLLRVEDQCGFSHLTLARSRDGFRNWRIAEEPTLPPDPTNHPEELWGIEDPRITRMENGDEEADEEGDLFAIVYTPFSTSAPRRVGSSCITGCGTPRPAPSTGWAWPCWICMIPPGFCADRTSGSWVLRLPMSGREMCPGSSSPAAGCSGTASCVSTTGRPTPQSP